MFVAAKLCWVVDFLHARIEHVQKENKLKGKGKYRKNGEKVKSFIYREKRGKDWAGFDYLIRKDKIRPGRDLTRN